VLIIWHHAADMFADWYI